MKTVVILYNQITAAASIDERDVLVQVEAVDKALRELGLRTERMELGLDTTPIMRRLRAHPPAAVFNLVESVEGDSRLISLAPSLLDHLGIPFSGCTAEAVFVTTNKTLSKKWLRLAGIRTPDWADLMDEETYMLRRPDSTFIVKSNWEHASSWFSEDSLVKAKGLEQLLGVLRDFAAKQRGDCFAERFVPGREFNVSVLAGHVLPIPEMVFEDYPEGKPCVVDYRAKWEEGSFEYQHTHRRFDFPPEDRVLLSQLKAISFACWKLYRLRGYARVDFRVDDRGIPWVLEINANPCISPDAGFVAAASRAGLGYTEMIRRILDDSLIVP